MNCRCSDRPRPSEKVRHYRHDALQYLYFHWSCWHKALLFQGQGPLLQLLFVYHFLSQSCQTFRKASWRPVRQESVNNLSHCSELLTVPFDRNMRIRYQSKEAFQVLHERCLCLHNTSGKFRNVLRLASSSIQ